MKSFDKLNNLFNLEKIEPTDFAIEKIKETSEDKKDSDFDLARETLRDLIAKNNLAIDEIISIARSSETARPFEVAGQLLKTQSDIAKDLLTLHKQKKEIEGEREQNIHQQNNIVFAGSTSDLMKMISGERAKIIDVNTEEK
jgi:hypothetical protein